MIVPRDTALRPETEVAAARCCTSSIAGLMFCSTVAAIGRGVSAGCMGRPNRRRATRSLTLCSGISSLLPFHLLFYLLPDCRQQTRHLRPGNLDFERVCQDANFCWRVAMRPAICLDLPRLTCADT